MGNLRRRRSPSESQEDESDSESDRRGRKTSSSSRNRAESESSRRKRSSHRSSSSKRRRRRSDDDESEPESSEDSDGYRRDRGKKKEVTEEEINEYMAKKTQKKALKVAKKLKSQGVSGFSNDSNPFGDNNLGETFVWRKKIERDVAQGRPLDISVKSVKKRQKERMARLKEIHASLLRKHLERLELPVVTDEGLETDKELKAEEEELMRDVEDDQQYSPELLGDEPRDEAELLGDEPRDEAEAEAEEEEPGSFSPQLIHAGEDDEAIDPQVDQAELDRKREAVVVEHQRRIQEAMTAKKAATPDELEMKAIKAMGIMEEGDAVFGSGAEVNLDSQVYWWHDKYRPRKPKYFNRVHTGYEWNKYNQTHYDHDNPPPKIVQGYKFNIFYPDLVDKTKAPTYTIEKDGNGETCIMRFHAGPPYEDIAFRIVNKEWEYSHKKGFKCTFERGILHVYFNFKRCRYRR